MIIVGFWWLLYKSYLSVQWQLYGVIVAGIAVCFGLYWMLGRRKRIARNMSEKYGISIEEYENMSDEERQKLKENNKEK